MTEEPVEIEAEDDPFDNVVRFGGRGPDGKGLAKDYEPPVPDTPTPREKIRGRSIDDDAIGLLKTILEEFHNGKNHGLALVAGKFDAKGNLVNYRFMLSEIACAYPVSFMGAVESMKLDLATMAPDQDDEGEHPIDDEEFLLSLDPDD